MRINDLGVSEVIGSMLLLGVAVVTAVAIYSIVLPIDFGDPHINVHISACETEESIIYQHEGGVSLDAIKIDIIGYNTDNVTSYFFYDVEIGDKVVIPNTNDNITANIYCNNQIIFEGNFNKSIQRVIT